MSISLRAPRIPREPVSHWDAPIDLNGREPNASTVYACNICYEATEERILEYFNSINGTFNPREQNVAVAVNFAYRKFTSLFDGKAFFLYSTVELAEYACEVLHRVPFLGRPPWVVISDWRLNVRSNRSNLIGSSRAGPRIWECSRPVGHRQQWSEWRE